MKALILAAGLGSRLAPITNSVPKSLVPVNGIPILFKQIDNLYKNGIRNITVVSGYLSDIMAEKISDKYPFVKIIENKIYDKTNNMYSAFLAKELFDDELLMMNADVFYDSSVISDLLRDDGNSLIAVDKGNYNGESMKIIFNGERITAISKSISSQNAYGTSIDVYKFSQKGALGFIERCGYYIEKQKELNLWSEVALNDILKDYRFEPCNICGKWVEIDDHKDLEYAEKLFAVQEEL